MAKLLKMLSAMALSFLMVFGVTSCSVSHTGDLTIVFYCSDYSDGHNAFYCFDDITITDVQVMLYDENGNALYSRPLVVGYEEGVDAITIVDLDEGWYQYHVQVIDTLGDVAYENEGLKANGNPYYVEVLSGINNTYDVTSIPPRVGPLPSPVTTGSLSFYLTNLSNDLFFGATNGYVIWAVYDSNDHTVCAGKKIAGQLSPANTISCGELDAGTYSYEIYLTDSYSNAADADSARVDTVHTKYYNSALTEDHFIDVEADKDNDYNITLVPMP